MNYGLFDKSFSSLYIIMFSAELLNPLSTGYHSCFSFRLNRINLEDYLKKRLSLSCIIMFIYN